MEISLISLLVEAVLEFFIEGQEAAYRPGDFNPNFITFLRHKKTSNMSPDTKRQDTAFYAPPPCPRHLVQTDPRPRFPTQAGPGLPHPHRERQAFHPEGSSGASPGLGTDTSALPPASASLASLSSSSSLLFLNFSLYLIPDLITHGFVSEAAPNLLCFI